MKLLSKFIITLPEDPPLSNKLRVFLANFGNIDGRNVELTSNDDGFLPKIEIQFKDGANPKAIFVSETNKEIRIKNETGKTTKSPHKYRSVDIDDFMNRISSFKIGSLDHIGFNMPWFDGVHPEILDLRKDLALKCAYFRFPTGENWDFILPASADEINNDIIDLEITRKPKVEIVSFEKSSTPLIQVDFSMHIKYEQASKLFPEAISVTELRNIWVYIENPWGVDICFVVNESSDEDWSNFFQGHRLTPYI